MLYIELQLRRPETIGKIFNVARKVALAESSALESSVGRKDKHLEFRRSSLSNLLERKEKSRQKKPKTFTPLNVSRESLGEVIKDKYGVCYLAPMKPQSCPSRDKTKFCSFHQDFGHTTKDCFQLKRVIERFIREGCLKEYVADAQQRKDKGERIIHMINPKISSVKKVKKKIYNLTKAYLVPEYEFKQHEVISFYNDELEHNEEAKITPIVLKVLMTREGIDKYTVRRWVSSV